MNIKKVDDKPIVIHTKQKTKLHVKSAPETQLKGENVLSVQRGSQIAGERVNADKVTVAKVQPKSNTEGTEDTKTAASQSEKETACQSVNKENQIYARYR